MADKTTPADLAREQQRLEAMREMVAASKEQNSELRLQVEQLGKAELKEQSRLSHMREELQTLKQAGKTKTEEYQLLQQIHTQAQEALTLQRQLSDEAERQNAIQEETNKTMETSVKSLTSMVGYSTQLGDSMKGTFKKKKGEEFGGMLKRVSKGFVMGTASVFGFRNILGSLIKSTIEFAFIQDKAEASFVRSTGAGREFAGAIGDASTNLFEYGMGANEASAATAALYTGVTGFNTASASTQRNLVETTAKLEAVGVSARDTTEIMQMMSRSFGMTHEQALGVVKDLEQFAVNTGQASAEVVSGFTRASKYLGVFGKRAAKVYKDSSKLARALGMDTNELIDSMKAFDTFDTAAESVAGLNAMLGGSYINTMDMVMERDPAKRMLMLKEALDNSNIAYSDMNEYQREAIANQMNMSVAQVDALKNMSPSTIRENADEQESLAKRSMEAADAMTKLQMTMGLIVGKFINPFLESIGGPDGAVAGLQDFAKSVGNVVDNLTPFFSLLGSVIKFLAKYWEITLGVVAAMKAYATYMTISTLLTNRAAAAKLKEAAAIELAELQKTKETAARFTASTSTIVDTTVTETNTAAKTKGTLAGWREVVSKKAQTLWEGLKTAAMTAGTGAMGLATLATTALTAANVPLAVAIGAVVAGVALGVAGFILMKDLVSGMPGPLKILVGIFIALAAAVAAWQIATTLGLGAISITAGIAAVGIGIGALMGAFGFAEGVTNFGGGMALVGEEGPELVTMGRGANVITNENTNKIAGAAANGGGMAGSQALIAALDRNTAALQGGSGANIAPAQSTGGGTVNNVVLNMNDREFARVVDERVDKVLQSR